MIIPEHNAQSSSDDGRPLGFFKKTCRMCGGSNLQTFLDFGMQPHSDGFLKEEQLKEPEPFFPLAVNLCTDCGQWQLTYTVSPDYLYGIDYVYDSTITQTGRTHFTAMAASIVSQYNIPADSLAVDIGSNVGLLLQAFKDQGLRVQGVDPAPTMTAIAREKGLDTVTACFSMAAAEKILEEKGQAAVITGTNSFAHIDDLDELTLAVTRLLKPDGVFVIEAPYLQDLIDEMEYDTIYHQHLSYLSIKPLVTFFGRHEMEIINVEKYPIHGGSIRVFVAHKGAYKVEPAVGEYLDKEKSNQTHTLETADAFSAKIQNHRRALIEMLISLKDKGFSLAGVGAPAKGSTLLNYCGINTYILPYTTEKNRLKVGRYTPGTHIPIKNDDELIKDKPDYALILPWNFAPEIMKNLNQYKENGGRFIVPIPTPEVV